MPKLKLKNIISYLPIGVIVIYFLGVCVLNGMLAAYAVYENIAFDLRYINAGAFFIFILSPYLIGVYYHWIETKDKQDIYQIHLVDLQIYFLILSYVIPEYFFMKPTYSPFWISAAWIIALLLLRISSRFLSTKWYSFMVLSAIIVPQICMMALDISLTWITSMYYKFCFLSGHFLFIYIILSISLKYRRKVLNATILLSLIISTEAAIYFSRHLMAYGARTYGGQSMAKFTLHLTKDFVDNNKGTWVVVPLDSTNTGNYKIVFDTNELYYVMVNDSVVCTIPKSALLVKSGVILKHEILE